MPPILTTSLLVVAGVAVWSYFFGDSGGDDKPVDNSAPSPPSASTTKPPDAFPPPASSSRGQTTVNAPATSHHNRDFSHLPTHDGDPRWTSLASTPTPRSYQQPSTPVRPVQAKSETQASIATPYYDNGWANYEEDGGISAVREDSLERTIHQEDGGFSAVWDDGFHCSRLASPSTGESPSRQAYPTSARLPASYVVPSGSTRVRHTTVRTSTTANNHIGCHCPGLPSPDAEESHLAHLTPSPELSSYSYLGTPSPDSPSADVFGSPKSPSPQTHSRTLSSSSDSDYHGANPLPRVNPRFRRPVLDGLHDMTSDAVTNKQNMEMARKLREQARRSHRERQVARDRAMSARKRRDSEAECTYSEEVRSHESVRKNLDKKAAKIIFRENNKAHKEGTVDLHGLYASEAAEYAKEEIQSAMYRNDETVCFITGKGSHADGGVSKLRPTLEELCDERKLAYSLDPENAGRLIVYLNRQK